MPYAVHGEFCAVCPHVPAVGHAPACHQAGHEHLHPCARAIWTPVVKRVLAHAAHAHTAHAHTHQHTQHTHTLHTHTCTLKRSCDAACSGPPCRHPEHVRGERRPRCALPRGSSPDIGHHQGLWRAALGSPGDQCLSARGPGSTGHVAKPPGPSRDGRIVTEVTLEWDARRRCQPSTAASRCRVDRGRPCHRLRRRVSAVRAPETREDATRTQGAPGHGPRWGTSRRLPAASWWPRRGLGLRAAPAAQTPVWGREKVGRAVPRRGEG